MKRLLVAAVSMALCACATIPAAPIAAPAPLTATAIDDQALEAAWRGFDAALDAINLLADAGAIKPGSAKAIAVADAIDRVTAALSAAEHAAKAGSSSNYLFALLEVKSAISDLRTALRLKG